MPREGDATKTRLGITLAISVALFLVAEILYVRAGSFFPGGFVVALVIVPSAFVGGWLLMRRDDPT